VYQATVEVDHIILAHKFTHEQVSLPSSKSPSAIELSTVLVDRNWSETGARLATSSQGLVIEPDVMCCAFFARQVVDSHFSTPCKRARHAFLADGSPVTSGG